MSKPKIGDSDSDDLDYLDDILNQAETKYKSRDNNESGELRESDLKNSKTLLKSRKSIEQMSDTSYDAFYSESERPSIGRQVIKTDPMQELRNRLNEIPIQTQKLMQKERQRLENEFNKQFERKKSEFDQLKKEQEEILQQQMNALEEARQKQERLELLADGVKANSISLSAISQQVQKERQKNDSEKNAQLVQIQLQLHQRENQILGREKVAEQERIWIQTQLKELEELDRQRFQQSQQSYSQLAVDRQQLQEMRQMLVKKEAEKKREFDIQSRKIAILSENLNNQLQDVKKKHDDKIKEWELQRSILDQQEQETLNLIERERKAIQERRELLQNTGKEISASEYQLNQRIKELEEREKQLQDEWDQFETQNAEFEDRKCNFEFQAQGVYQLSLDNHSNSQQLQELKKRLQEERLELDNSKSELQTIFIQANQSETEADSLHQSNRIRSKIYEQQRMKAVSEYRMQKDDLSYFKPMAAPMTIKYENYSVQASPSLMRFSAVEYLKELEPYYQDRTQLQSWMENQGNFLIQSKLEVESSNTESLAESLRPAEMSIQDSDF